MRSPERLEARRNDERGWTGVMDLLGREMYRDPKVQAYLRNSIRSLMAIDGEQARSSGVRFNREVPWVMIDRELTRDIRGLDCEARGSLWSFLSRCAVALRGRGVAGKVSWTISRPRGTTPYAHIKRVMMGGSNSADMYDYFFAWRCQCEALTEWTLDHPKHLPRKDGYYGNCSMCGAVALEIKTDG
jgi:hypothetical protein